MTDPQVLVTGSSGFIGGYVVEELLRRGFRVVGVDNHSKYGKVTKSYDDDPRYELVEADAQDTDDSHDTVLQENSGAQGQNLRPGSFTTWR